MQGFWNNLKKPFFVLAPMADVTDSAFRQIICKYGKPDVCFTEFVSADGLCSEGKDRLMLDLLYTEVERPIVAQIFGANAKNFYKTARMFVKMGFDGIDINMGCPEKNIQKQGSCASLIKNPSLAQEIIVAVREGAGNLPVSVKTRIGYNQNEIAHWIPALLEAKPDVITIHGRTKKDMSKAPADWDAIKRASDIVKSSSSSTLIIGNGDVKDIDDGIEKANYSGVDGIMFGRAVFGNPWLFSREIRKEDLTLAEILRVLLEHTLLFEKLYSGKKNFLLMRKHFCSYVSGFAGAKELRAEFMRAMSSKEVKAIIRKSKQNNVKTQMSKLKCSNYQQW